MTLYQPPSNAQPCRRRERTDKLGVVIGGSLSEGLDVKLDRDIAHWRSWPSAATWWPAAAGAASSA